MAFEANQVWNAANEETSLWCHVPIPEVGYMRFHISAFDLQKQLKSIKKERNFIIHSSTVQETSLKKISCVGESQKQVQGVL